MTDGTILDDQEIFAEALLLLKEWPQRYTQLHDDLKKKKHR